MFASARPTPEFVRKALRDIEFIALIEYVFYEVEDRLGANPHVVLNMVLSGTASVFKDRTVVLHCHAILCRERLQASCPSTD